MRNFHQQEHLPALESKSKKLPWLLGGLALSALCALLVCGILTLVYAVNFARNSPRPGVAPAHGVKVIFQVQPDSGEKSTFTEMEQCVETLTERANSYHIKSYSFQISGTDSIEASLPKDGRLDEIIKNFSQAGLMEFVDMGNDMVIEGTEIVTDYPTPGKALADQQVRHTIFTGEVIQQTSVSIVTTTDGNYSILFEVNEKGKNLLSEHTRNNIGKVLAIVIDKKVITSPTINSPITEGAVIIEGNYTKDSANDLAALLRAKALPFPLKVIETKDY